MPMAASSSPGGRYLLHRSQASDGGPGLSHTLSEYLGGVALAHRFGLCLVYEPIVCGHGLGDAFEQLLWGAAEDVADGIVPPFCAPHIQVSTDGRTVTAGGHAINRVVLEGRRPDSKDLSNELIAKTLSTVSPGSLVLLLKAQAYKSMRMTERMGAECSKSPRAYYYSGLWLRERYWRAVHRMHERSPRWEESRTLHKPPSLLATALAKVRAKMGSLGRQDSSRASDGPTGLHGSRAAVELSTVRICVHVRRGDLMKMMAASRGTPRAWTDLRTVLASLRAISAAIELPLHAPHVAVTILTEAGFTRSARSLHPRARSPQDLLL